MKKITVDIKGMHCKSCEMLIEEELLKVRGVKWAKVNQRKGIAEIGSKHKVSMSDISCAVQEAGYSLGKDIKPLFSKNPNDYVELGIALLVVFILWAVFYLYGGNLDFKISSLNNYASLPIVFLIGITAGLSTCMALIGGLVLGAAARFAETNPTATALEKFKPHLFFNLGRIVSFFILGGVIGFAGSFVKFNAGTMGFLVILVGMVMFFLGFQLIEIFPRLSGKTITMPKFIGNALGLKKHSESDYSHKSAVILGAITFFLPCGFTQAMQLYAMSTGNPIAGSLTMGVFALGTAPGLLSIGGLTSIVRGAFARMFFKFAGVVVILLAIYNISSGVTLSGINSFSLPSLPSSNTSTAQAAAQPAGDVQVLKATYDPSNDMQPKSFTVKAGVPARLEVNALANGAGCMGSITIPQLDSNVQVFKQGQTAAFNFTASNPGTYQITCAMGIPHGTIVVQ